MQRVVLMGLCYCGLSPIPMFGRGDGQDTLTNYDMGQGRRDAVQFGASIAATDVVVSRLQDDLILSIRDRQDRLTVKKYFTADALDATVFPFAIDEIRFADGTTWDRAAVMAHAFQADDVIDIKNTYAGKICDLANRRQPANESEWRCTA